MLAGDGDRYFCPVCGIGLAKSDFDMPPEHYYCPYCSTRQTPLSEVCAVTDPTAITVSFLSAAFSSFRVWAISRGVNEIFAGFTLRQIGTGVSNINEIREQPEGSLRIATAPDHGTDPTELIRFADEALYEAKGAGRNTIRKAMHALQAEGKIVRQVGSGTFVAEPRAPEHASQRALRAVRVVGPLPPVGGRLLAIEGELQALRRRATLALLVDLLLENRIAIMTHGPGDRPVPPLARLRTASAAWR